MAVRAAESNGLIAFAERNQNPIKYTASAPRIVASQIQPPACPAGKCKSEETNRPCLFTPRNHIQLARPDLAGHALELRAAWVAGHRQNALKHALAVSFEVGALLAKRHQRMAVAAE